MDGTLAEPPEDLLRIPIENNLSFDETTFFSDKHGLVLPLPLGTVYKKKRLLNSIFSDQSYPRSTVPTAGTDCFLCFPATNPIYSVDFRSAPLNSDDFLTTGFRSGFCRKNSGKFRKISTGIRWKLTKPIGTDRNLSDEIRTEIL
jgi:hypothetical protein